MSLKILLFQQYFKKKIVHIFLRKKGCLFFLPQKLRISPKKLLPLRRMTT